MRHIKTIMTNQVENNIKVSIVIVCMNNLKNLYPCLNSIKHFTTISYECFVVAYLFSRENLEKVQKDFPWVRFIESNEIRGFSENNNLALKQAKGKYCFVLNDDTEMKMPVIDRLFSQIEHLPSNVAIISPKTIFGDGRLQSCGRPRLTYWKYVRGIFKLYNEVREKSRYVNQKGVFQSYNIVGAAFMIKTHIFKSIGFFNEKYFFCPEDIEVSTILNKLGYQVYVDSDIVLYHYEGGSYKISRTRTATMPASAMGSLLFYCGNNSLKRYFTARIVRFQAYLKMQYWKRRINTDRERAQIMIDSFQNIYDTICSTLTPKEIFIKYFKL